MYSSDRSTIIEKLNGTNYQLWKFKIEMVLSRDDLWDLITDDAPTELTAEWKKWNKQAMATISLLVEDSQLIHIRNLTTVKSMWTALQKLHERSNLTSKLFLLRKIYKMRLLKEIVEKLCGIGENMADHHVAAIILCSLPEDYAPLITSMEARSEDEITLELVRGKLLDESLRRLEFKNEQKEKNEIALKVSGRFNNSRSRPTRDMRKCYYCDKAGHIKKFCKIWQAQRVKSQDKSKDNTSSNRCDLVYDDTFDSRPTKSSHEKSEKVDQSYDKYCFHVSAVPLNVGWYIDSGATCHMTGERNFFRKLNDKIESGTVSLADGGKLEIKGIGEGVIHCVSLNGVNNDITVKNVLYIPRLKGGLLSVKVLTSLGYEIAFKDSECLIYKGKNIVATGELFSGLYKIKSSHQAMVVHDFNHNNDCIHMWHRRLGHRDPLAVQKLCKENMATGIKLKDCGIKQLCVECIGAKMTRESFPKASHNRAMEPFVLVHTDVCGPMRTETPAGNKYMLTFIDDYSRYCEIYILRNKSDVDEKLKLYLEKGKNKFGRRLQTLRSDGGGEYFSKSICDYLRNEGIVRQVTVPYSPEQNGVAERKNRSLIEMGKCMLLDSKLHDKYWGEAITMASYLQNRLPHSSCEVTPFELWNGFKPDLEHIKVFGCRVFNYIPKQKRHKLDCHAEEGLFMGYSDESKGYRILIPSTNRIVISRSVKFIEDEAEMKPSYTDRDTDIDTESTHVSIDMNPLNIKVLAKTEDDAPKLRRSTRPNFGIPAKRLVYTATVDQQEPSSWEQIQELPEKEKQKWIEAMNEEMVSFEENKTWKLVPPPDGKSVIANKWVYKKKYDSHGNVNRYKARLVAKGFTQKYGEDYDGTFAPVVKHTTLRVLLTIAGKRNMKTKHLDVKSAFLYGTLTEEIYMEQPANYVQAGKENFVCKLEKCIYGLKQAARVWNIKINQVLLDYGFNRGTADPCVYTQNINSKRTYILLYVDDLLICSDTDQALKDIKELLERTFQMKDLGILTCYLGIQVEKDAEGNYLISQTNKVKGIVKQFGMESAKDVSILMESHFFLKHQQMI